MALLTQWYVPAALAAAGAAVALMFDAWDRRREAAVLAIAGALAAAATGVAMYLTVPGSRGAGSMIAALAGLGAVALAGGWRTLVGDERGGRTSALAGLAIASTLLAISAPDMIALFAALEGMALSAYALVALGGTDAAREAAMKYFVQGAVATGLLLMGLAVLFASTGGSAAYGAVLAAGPDFPRGAMLLAWAFVTVALTFKMGAFPFHAWAPDAYQTAASPVAGLLSSVVKGGAIVAATVLVGTRALGAAGAGDASIVGMVSVIAAGSIVYGNFAALTQRSLKRMLAYSGIAQVGYALIGVASGGRGATLLLVLAYAPAALAAFLAVEAISANSPHWDGSVRGLSGLSRRQPALALALAAVMLSLTGVPLFVGFWGKLAVFVEAARGGLLWLALVGALGSVVSFGYYGGVIRSAFMGEDVTSLHAQHGADPALVAACGLAAVIVLAGVIPLALGTSAVRLVLGG